MVRATTVGKLEPMEARAERDGSSSGPRRARPLTPRDGGEAGRKHEEFVALPTRELRHGSGHPVAAPGQDISTVLLGNVLSEIGRDLYSAAVIYCGHVGAADYPPGARASGRGQWYVMQAEGSRDIELPTWLSILCGGLDKQIEHHLFPRLPPNRLREIAPRVRAICEKHGVRYRSPSWRSTLQGCEIAQPSVKNALRPDKHFVHGLTPR